MSLPELLPMHFTIWRAFRVGYGAAFRHPLLFAMSGLLVGIPAGVFVDWVLTHLLHSGIVLLDFVYAFSIMVILCAAFGLIQCSVAFAVRAHMLQEKVTLGQCFENGFASLPRLVMVFAWATLPVWVFPVVRVFMRASIVMNTTLTYLLLCIVLTMVAPVAVNEPISGFGLIRRAWRLYAGTRWRGLGTVMLVLLTIAIFYACLAIVFARFGVRGEARYQIAVFSFVWAFGSAPSAAAYHLRRGDLEGTAELDLAPVFD